MELTIEQGWIAVAALVVLAVVVFGVSVLCAVQFWMRADLGADTAPVVLSVERPATHESDR